MISRGLAGMGGSFSTMTDRGGGGMGGNVFVTNCAEGTKRSHWESTKKYEPVMIGGMGGGRSRKIIGGGERGGGGRWRTTCVVRARSTRRRKRGIQHSREVVVVEAEEDALRE